jgi:hypothetical protein
VIFAESLSELHHKNTTIREFKVLSFGVDHAPIKGIKLWKKDGVKYVEMVSRVLHIGSR